MFGLIQRSILCSFGAAALSASAATYYSGPSGTAGGGFTIFKWFDDAACTVASAPQPTPKENDGNTYVLLTSSKSNNNVTFPEGCFVEMGLADGSKTFAPGNWNTSSMTWTIPNCKVYGFTSRPNWASGGSFMGNYTLYKTQQSITIGANNLPSGSTYGQGLGGTFTAAEDVTVSLAHGSSAKDNTGITLVTLNGDFSAYKGNVSANNIAVSTVEGAGYLRILLTSESAMGDRSYSRPDAFILRNRSEITIKDGVTQSAERGITFTLAANEYAALRANKNESWTLTAPTAGATGTLKKTGVGKVTLAGPISLSNIVVEEGVLELVEGSTFASGTAITVKDGARVIATRSTGLQGLAVTTEGSGLVSWILPYDDATRTVTAPTISDAADYAWPLSFEFSQKIGLPVNETTNILVATFTAENERKVTAEDFVYTGEKTCGLPHTSFAVEEAEDGTRRVYLVVKAAVGQTGGKIGVEKAWSDETKKEVAGKDYYMIYGVSSNNGPRLEWGANIASYTFQGDSYTMCGRSSTTSWVTLNDYAVVFTCNDLRMYGGSSLNLIRASDGTSLTAGVRERTIEGNIFVDESATKTFPAHIYTVNTTNRVDVNAKFSGTGTVRFYSGVSSTANEANNSTSEHPASIHINGDNTSFKGRFSFNPQDVTRVTACAVTNANAFGGSPDEFLSDGVFVDTTASNEGLVIFEAEQDITVETPNRGWSLSYATLRAATNATFTFKAPLILGNRLIKDGAGTVAFAPASLTASAPKPLLVKAGTVRALDDVSYTNLNLTVSDGAGFRVTGLTRTAFASATGADASGVKALSVAPVESEAKIAVVPDATDAVLANRTFSAAICSVPESNADLTTVLAPLKFTTAQGTFIGTVAKEDPVDGWVRYVCTWSAEGTMVIFR